MKSNKEESIEGEKRKEKNNKTVLIVDDVAANRQVLAAFLTHFGLVTIDAATGNEAIALFEKQRFSLVFLDIHLPDQNGFHVLQSLRAIESSRTPIVALSADDLTSNRLNYLIKGFDDYLAKPVTIASLNPIITRWTDLRLSDATSVRKNAIAKDRMKNMAPVDIGLSLSLCNDNASLALDLLTKLLAELPDIKNKLSAKKQMQDVTTFTEDVHRLKGGISYCGLPQLRLAVSELYRALNGKEAPQTISSKWQNTEQAIDELLDWSDNHDLTVLFDRD